MATKAFVRKLRESFGLEILVEHAIPGAGNLEQEARRARRAFFLRCRLERIALGHTRSDQAETVLFACYADRG